MTEKEKLVVGVDIGGTNIKIGLVKKTGEVIDFQTHSLVRNKDQTASVSFICKKVKKFVDLHAVEHQIVGVGVASPGILDSEKGIIHHAVNLGWYNLELVHEMKQYINLEIRLIGDAIAGALGEQCYSAARMENYMYICIGTGVGASLISGKESSEKIVNLGHISLNPNGRLCKCGNKGCLENEVSATALPRKVEKDLGFKQSVLKDYQKKFGKIEAHHIYEAAKSDDTYAQDLFQEAGKLLGIAIVNCIHLFDVKNFIIGGGLSHAGSLLLEPIRKEVSERIRHENITIKCAAMPTKAGVLGAARKVFT